MFKWTTLVWTGLACCLTLPALTAGTDMGCLPPPLTQDYLKKTVRVEIKGQLEHVRIWLEEPRDPLFPMPSVAFLDYWQISVGGKTYILEFGERKDLTDLTKKLENKTVIATGTLEGNVVHVTGLMADEDYVKETTEVEVRGQLLGQHRWPGFDFPNPILGWNIQVDGKTYGIDFATPELRKLAEPLDRKAVLIAGVLHGDTITVQTLKAAQ